MGSSPYVDGFRFAYVFCALYVFFFALGLVYQMLSILFTMSIRDCLFGFL
jgi:hypothetical protein